MVDNSSFLLRKKPKKLIFSLILVFLFDFFLFPAPTLASDLIKEAQASETLAASEDDNQEIKKANIEEKVNKLPVNGNINVKKSGSFLLTAYNSEASQTDGSPCITANGFNVCKHGIEDTVAANFLPFGTKIKIPSLFGDRVFVVRDRMNARYSDRVDVWMLKKQDAKKFGVRLAKIEVLEP